MLQERIYQLGLQHKLEQFVTGLFSKTTSLVQAKIIYKGRKFIKNGILNNLPSPHVK